AEHVGGHERAVDGEDHAELVRRGAEPSDDAGERSPDLASVVENRKRKVEAVPLLAHREALVAHLAEELPADLGERPSSEPRKRFRHAEARARAADEEDAGQAAGSRRHGSEYTFRPPPRTKPHSVTPRSCASSTARLDGAPTATSIGQPATAAFCTSSNESRPLTQRREWPSGSRPRPNAQPTTLSIALCRPTSSRMQSSSPASSKSPVAWRPPVEAKAGCDARRRSGSSATSAAATRSELSIRGAS